MPIYQTAHYQVRPDAVDQVKAAIKEFVAYVTDNEPGSILYAAWQEKNDPRNSCTCSRSPTRRRTRPMAAPPRSGRLRMPTPPY